MSSTSVPPSNCSPRGIRGARSSCSTRSSPRTRRTPPPGCCAPAPSSPPPNCGPPSWSSRSSWSASRTTRSRTSRSPAPTSAPARRPGQAALPAGRGARPEPGVPAGGPLRRLVLRPVTFARKRGVLVRSAARRRIALVPGPYLRGSATPQMAVPGRRAGQTLPGAALGPVVRPAADGSVKLLSARSRR